MEFNYLLVPRGSLDSKNNVVKVGRTINPVNRLIDYPKGSKMYCVMLVVDAKATEDKICDTFRKLFIHRKDYGNEYFEGDIDEMKKYFSIICEESSCSIEDLYDENDKIEHTSKNKKKNNLIENPIEVYVNERLEYSDKHIKMKTVYDDYINWCEHKNIDVIKRKIFSKMIKQYVDCGVARFKDQSLSAILKMKIKHTK